MNRAANITKFREAHTLRHDSLEASLEKPDSFTVTDDFTEEVAHAEAQLEGLLERQQEVLRQKDQLERLQEKQSCFQSTRSELIQDLEHALEGLERNLLESEQLMENYSRARECFSQHLAIISALRCEDWHRDQLEYEIERATFSIGEARHEYDQAIAHLDRLAKELSIFHGLSSSGGPISKTARSLPVKPHNFLYWLRSGFAFTLPVMIFGIITLLTNFFFN